MIVDINSFQRNQYSKESLQLLFRPFNQSKKIRNKNIIDEYLYRIKTLQQYKHYKNINTAVITVCSS